jgi:predicted dienelactone hydrolase
VVNQPADIHFLIDTLLARSAERSDPLFGTIDSKRIAVAGVSLGGLTSTLAAFDRRLRDPRIAAAVSIAGPAYMFTPRFFEASTVPFLMVAGDADAIVPYARNAQRIPDIDPGSVLVTLAGASHTGFAGPAATLLRFYRNPDVLGCREVRKGLANADLHFLDSISDANIGIVLDRVDPPCTGPLPATAMKAARQHVLTTLAVAAFLDSHFAADAATRVQAQRFLLKTFPDENAREVRVETRPDSR